MGAAWRALLPLLGWAAIARAAEGNQLANFHPPEGATAAQIEMHRQILIVKPPYSAPPNLTDKHRSSGTSAGKTITQLARRLLRY